MAYLASTGEVMRTTYLPMIRTGSKLEKADRSPCPDVIRMVKGKDTCGSCGSPFCLQWLVIYLPPSFYLWHASRMTSQRSLSTLSPTSLDDILQSNEGFGDISNLGALAPPCAPRDVVVKTVRSPLLHEVDASEDRMHHATRVKSITHQNIYVTYIYVAYSMCSTFKQCRR